MFGEILIVIAALFLMAVVTPLFLMADEGKRPARYGWGLIMFFLVGIAFWNTFKILLQFLTFALTILFDTVFLVVLIVIIVWITGKILNLNHDKTKDEK
jgi:hypothetical protein